ncbi:hypothetical protein LO771_22235 [Streptacidiphilus sp. ASG 303]|uniref:hypothetical protein n=1 Tax=Streptacidiphilus sp. ASG 303 TaxID=2896847 RepID=UPI001E2D734B|nr:hypothetical protein [Streptacidiphilus sp. ASG 303]MCD0485026.1 hypothetical protein [Streptacidiphilus sp. ASG 303]
MTAPGRTGAPAPCFAAARAVADAVLLEGYVLYPYRASAAKNRLRWQFGVLVPPAWAGGTDSGEHSALRTEVLAEPRRGAVLHAELRFLHARRRTVQRALPGGGFEDTDALELPDRVLVPWDEGVEERVEVRVDVAGLCEEGAVLPFRREAGEEAETVRDASGAVAGRLLRRRERVDGVLRLGAVEVPGPCRVLRVTASVENTSDWTGDGDGVDRGGYGRGYGGAEDGGRNTADGGREEALTRSLVSAHLVLGLTAGSFVSPTDPPEWARAAVAECRNEHAWPVLAGTGGTADVVLASPIVLEDHPRIAPESPGALYDATEIDEILALRTAALTEQEKREARGTDDRAAAAVDLADSLPPEVLDRLHGAVRALREATGPRQPSPPAPDGPPGAPGPPPGVPWWDPAADRSVDPSRDRVLVDGVAVAAGSRVVIRPGRRRTDAQDLFLHGRGALVEAVVHDVDGGVHLAVTVDGDPGAELRRMQGRFLYFRPDEVAPLEDA